MAEELHPCFPGAGLGPLVPVKGILNSSAYQEILDNFMLPTLWKQFADGPFLFQHDCAPVHKAKSIKTWMSQFGVEELDLPDLQVHIRVKADEQILLAI